MSDLSALYQELILDHSRSPHHFGPLDPVDCKHEGYNPLCGDKVTVYLREKNNIIEAAQFEGTGCAISIASASLMTGALLGKTHTQVEEIFSDFHHLVTTGNMLDNSVLPKKFQVLAGVSAFPMRVKCATLAWHTALAALQEESESV